MANNRLEKSEPSFLQILNAFDRYLSTIENANLVESVDVESVSLAFKYAEFVEAAVTRAKNDDKLELFEQNLHDWWKKSENRKALPACSILIKACDKFLEVYMKSTSVSNEVVDRLLNLYIQSRGKSRLNEFIKTVLTQSSTNNIAIESLVDLGLDVSKIDDEALVQTWEYYLGLGKPIEVFKYIDKMLNDGYIVKTMNIYIELENNSPIRDTIIDCLVAKSNAYDVQFVLSLLSLRKKILYKILDDNISFLNSLIDCIFYLGNSMKLKNGCWVSNGQFSHRDLQEFIEILLDGPSLVYDNVAEKLKYAKTEQRPNVWEDIVAPQA